MSQFLRSTYGYTGDNPSGIDFDSAVKLPEGGSTCDIYKTRSQRREVFVKRLKEGFRSKPVYFDALDKEFDIGVSLTHHSLPQYREFGRDYIVMDYIDGMTLAEMIKNHDPWLTDENHIVKLLHELVDVVDYLHRHNVVHCDIKPDNIMITSNGKNLVLVDFDKSYTDALNDTSGDPGKYGLPSEAKGRFAIDFRGIGMVVERLKVDVPGFKFSRYRQFVKICYSPEENCEVLNAVLDYTPSRFKAQTTIILIGLVVVILVVYFLFNPNDNHTKNTVVPDDVEVPVDSVSKPTDTPTAPKTPANTPVAFPQSPAISETKHYSDTDEKFAILCYEVKPFFDELITALNTLDSIKCDSTISGKELLNLWNRYTVLEHKNIDSVMGTTKRIFNNVSENELGEYLSATPSYKRYISRSKAVKDPFNREIDRFRTQHHE